MPRMHELKRRTVEDLRLEAREYEERGTPNSLLLAADFRDIVKGKLVDISEQLKTAGALELADVVFRDAQKESEQAFENRRISRRMRLRDDESRSKIRTLARV